MILRRELLAFPFALQSAAAPRILLNHFYATVDRATYRAIAADTFLQQQFAPFEERTTVRSDSTYSGLYFYGDQTYFEFFEENQGGRKPGDAGLALGSEDPGGSAWLKAQWGKLRPSINTMTTRQLDGSAIDWFETTSFQETREWRAYACSGCSMHLALWRNGMKEVLLPLHNATFSPLTAPSSRWPNCGKLPCWKT